MQIRNICQKSIFGNSEICRYNPLNYFVGNKRTDHSQYEIVYAFLYMYLEICDSYNKLKVQNCQVTHHRGDEKVDSWYLYRKLVLCEKLKKNCEVLLQSFILFTDRPYYNTYFFIYTYITVNMCSCTQECNQSCRKMPNCNEYNSNLSVDNLQHRYVGNHEHYRHL